MCTNYVAPGEDSGLSELRIDSFVDLYRWRPWKPEIYQDYLAPIVATVDGLAGFGFLAARLQTANIERAKTEGKKLRAVGTGQSKIFAESVDCRSQSGTLIVMPSGPNPIGKLASPVGFVW
ncbi:hypothetical protein WJ21_21670 [Burkholderia vietnamiensis]|nr:hypothetical protein WJ21_21670 [Burkholderia vietnamiensis]